MGIVQCATAQRFSPREGDAIKKHFDRLPLSTKGFQPSPGGPPASEEPPRGTVWESRYGIASWNRARRGLCIVEPVPQSLGTCLVEP
jgi:hypothetical protein